MAEDDMSADLAEEDVTWSSKKRVRSGKDRRAGSDRRQMTSRAITVPDMRSGIERRSGQDRRKVRLVITGRAINV